jgi:predicted dehydrogenase
MSLDSKLSFAVIGAGLIGPRHARTIAGSSSARIVAIVDPAPAGASLATELNVAHYKSVAELLQSGDKPDAAIICTPNHTHVPVSRELSSGGVHILIEKPFSTDIASGESLLEHLKSTNVKTLVGHHRRFNPYMVRTKQIVSSGRLGDIIAVNGLWTTCKPLDYFDTPAEWKRGETGGVVLINLIHEVDLLHYLFGQIISVHAEKTISNRGFEAEEGAALTLRFQSGVVGSFLVSDNVPSPHNFESGTGENPLIPKTGQDFYRIFGTEASLSVPDMSLWSYRGKVKSWNQELTQENIHVESGLPFDLQLDHFVEVIRGKEVPSCTPQAGLGALIVCQAIKHAIEENKTVKIQRYEL